MESNLRKSRLRINIYVRMKRRSYICEHRVSVSSNNYIITIFNGLSATAAFRGQNRRGISIQAELAFLRLWLGRNDNPRSTLFLAPATADLSPAVVALRATNWRRAMPLFDLRSLFLYDRSRLSRTANSDART